MEEILNRIKKIEEELKKEREINRTLQFQIADMNEKIEENSKIKEELKKEYKINYNLQIEIINLYKKIEEDNKIKDKKIQKIQKYIDSVEYINIFDFLNHGLRKSKVEFVNDNNEIIFNYNNHLSDDIFYIIKDVDRIIGNIYLKINTNKYNWHYCRGEYIVPNPLFVLFLNNNENIQDFNKLTVYLIHQRHLNGHKNNAYTSELGHMIDLSVVTINEIYKLILCRVNCGYITISNQQFIVGMYSDNIDKVTCIKTGDIYNFNGYRYLLQK